MTFTLSIGIPSYRRAEDVALQVAGVLDALPDLPVTVIDDGPDEAVAQALAPFSGRITLHRHATNLGYAATFAELIAQCATTHILLSADDDLCDPEALRATQAMLREHAPDFAATWFMDAAGTRKRGRDHPETLSLADLRDASGHAPGLVYRAEAARAALPFLQSRLDAGCYAARTYPQVLVVAYIALSGGRCLWLPVAPVREGRAHPPALQGPNGQGYDSPAARLLETEAFDNAFEAMAEFLPATATERLGALRLVHRQDLYRRFMRALRKHHPALVSDWLTGSMRYLRPSFARHIANSWSARRAGARAEAILRDVQR
ncbi:glycosyltransferase [Roseibaca sp. V10]|uniref:Glycosyltransferase n=1 Tax=Roseinatronobacter domitianus TaxID=2940293 RepID=A0ABT0M2S8_9RHOB|nr:glycosyltransferase [Roseibaca domitiana]MCL1629152.1 glycosyltransferase [Roseibaca domitiana]